MRFKLIVPNCFGGTWCYYITKDSWKEACEYAHNIETQVKGTVLIYEENDD